MQISKFERKPFFVDAVRVTEENINQVASWCADREAIKVDEKGLTFIQVKVHHPLNYRQTQAYVGDWVLYAGKGFKVYTNKAFKKNFESVFVEIEKPLPIGVTMDVVGQRPAVCSPNEELSENQTQLVQPNLGNITALNELRLGGLTNGIGI